MAVGSGIQVFLLKTIISDGLPPVFRGEGGLDITMTGRLDFTEEGSIQTRRVVENLYSSVFNCFRFVCESSINEGVNTGSASESGDLARAFFYF